MAVDSLARFKGIVPPIASPCNVDDSFDVDEFTRLAEQLCRLGVHGLYVCGRTGDCDKMHLAERQLAARIAADVVRSYGAFVIVHVGAGSIRDAATLAAHAAAIGADAISAVRPPNCSHRQALAYYSDLTRATRLPFFIYHFPTSSGTDATADELIELLDIEHVVGLKFTDWNLPAARCLLNNRPSTVVFFGYEEMLCPALLYGCAGGIATYFNVVPKLFVRLYRAVEQKDLTLAMELQKLAISLIAYDNRLGIGVFEHLMNKRGLARRVFRGPRPLPVDGSCRGAEAMADIIDRTIEKIEMQLEVNDVG